MVRMKAFCYLTLLLAFIMFYNKNPTIALLILGISLGLFVIFRKRKHSSSASKTSGLLSFRKHSSSLNNSETALMTFLLMQSLNPQNFPSQKPHKVVDTSSQQKSDLQKIKEEVLALLEGGEP